MIEQPTRTALEQQHWTIVVNDVRTLPHKASFVELLMSKQQFEGVWCLVANVAPEQIYGEQHTVRLEAKHFSKNTKWMLLRCRWMVLVPIHKEG
jgi:hypothetical protein